MQLSDEQIVLLEQLTYLTDEVAHVAGVTPGTYTSVEDLLKKFDENALKRLEQSSESFSGEISGAEWASIIRKIQEDKQLYSLKIADNDPDVYAIVYTDPNAPSSAIVTFRGTASDEEWADNVDGLYKTDTKCQKEALEYIENLPYSDITVAGHSKGGNKAQYVTILSDKVNRCVSMDGQGFSQEFLDKYYAEIQQKGGCIKNYYLEADFVNILLFPVPNSEQNCIKGKDGVNLAGNHSPAAFFQYAQDEHGNWYLELNPDGSLKLLPGQRNELMQYAHDFTAFLLNVMPRSDRADVGVYLRYALALAMDYNGNYHVEIDGVVYTKENMLDYLLSDPEMLSLVLAYFLKYVDTYNLSSREIAALAEFLGIDVVLSLLKQIDFSDPKVIAITGGVLLVGDDLYEWLFGQLEDGKKDKIILKILGWAQKKYNWDVDLQAIWENTDKHFNNIPGFNPSTATNNGTVRADKVRDFSQNAYDTIIQTINSIESSTYGSVSEWSAYSGEKWYSSLMIGNAIRGINKFFTQVSELNQTCKTRITEVFDDAAQADTDNAGKLQRVNEQLHKAGQGIQRMANILE